MYTTLKGGDTLAWYYWAFSRHKFPNLEVLTFPISKNTFRDVINREMSRDTYKDFHLIRKVKQLLTETGMVGKSYFNNRKRKVSKISAGGRLRKNNQALSYLRKMTRS